LGEAGSKPIETNWRNSMAKKKAAVKKGSRKAADKESLAGIRSSQSSRFALNTQPYVLIGELEKFNRKGATLIKFKATVYGEAVITNFSFDLQLNQDFPYKFVIHPSDDHKEAIVNCWFYKRSGPTGTDSLVGDPEDEFVIVVVNSGKLKRVKQ
jgi:hypothetical protein